MPGPIHDGLLALLTQFRTLAFELAAACGAGLHGEHCELRMADSVFQDPGNTGRLFTADAVLIGLARREDKLVVVDGLALEIQTWHDQLKLISWDVYRSGVRSRHRCRAWTMVLSPFADVRRRARELFEHEQGLCPLIVEPELIPAIDDISLARARPELAILSAVMHAESEVGVACARAARAVLEELPPEFRKCYLDLINACVPEEEMFNAAQLLTSPPPSPIQRLPDEIESQLSPQERNSAWYILKLRELQALEHGRQAGLQEGRQEGRQEAFQEGFVSMLATLWDTLAHRNIEIDPESRARVQQCRDAGVLSRLLVRAATATSVADLQLD